MKKTICVLLAISLCLSLCACSVLNPTVEGKGYDSPEEALLAYAEALKTGDVDKILSTFAVETYVENFDLAAYWDYYKAALPSNTIRVDSIDTYTTSVNLISRQYAITKNLTNLYWYVACDGELSYHAVISVNGDPYDSADDLLDEIVMEDWMEILSEMEFGDDFVYVEDIRDDEDFLDTLEDNLENQCDYYGCDEIVSLALEIELDGEDYLLCVNTACYDGKWYNLECMGTIGAVMGCPAVTGGLYMEE